MSEHADVVVIGGGQAGLAAGYYLRRAGLNFVILDRQDRAGGAWRHGWDSLRLFSPAEYSPLPGWPMPRQRGETFPTAGHVVEYLHDYEQRYELPVHRPVQVSGVRAHSRGLSVETDRGTWNAEFVISATGTWDTPFMPAYPGMADFAGEQLHTVDYSVPERFRGQRVLVVGAGNSAAQIVAEVSTIAETTWATRHPPRFMPDDVDGRVLFDTATREEAARKAGTQADGVSGLGDIVMVPSVRAARDRGVLRPRPMFDRLTAEGGLERRHHGSLRRDHLVHRLPSHPEPSRVPGPEARERRAQDHRHTLRRRAPPAPARVRGLDRLRLSHPDRGGQDRQGRSP